MIALFMAAALLGAPAPRAHHKLLVISVDGLDWRYLRDRDAMKLGIPNIRRLLKEGQVADGVVGVWPTITWPSHTSLITGKRPDEHGILGNRRPKTEGGDYYWTVDLLKARTLWQAAHEAGLSTAAVTWPVTVGASIDDNLPEYFLRRQGGEMDLAGVALKATPGLPEAITAAYPSFAQQWMDDRTRTQAVLYLLRGKQPDLILLHLVDLDSEEHDQGPFGQNANAMLERTDELIGQMLEALPAGYEVALVSDHGFERVDHTANLRIKVQGELQVMGGIAVTRDPQVAEQLKHLAEVGRQVPEKDLASNAPKLSGSLVFEPAEHIMFGPSTTGEYLSPPYEKGNHGFWPTRDDYRSVYVLWGAGLPAKSSGPMKMVNIAGELAQAMGLTWHP